MWGKLAQTCKDVAGLATAPSDRQRPVGAPVAEDDRYRLGRAITYNTEWGVESELPASPVPAASQDEFVELFLAHIVQTGGLD